MKKHSLWGLIVLLLLTNVPNAFSQITVSTRYKHFKYPSIAKIVEVIDARSEKENEGLIINQEAEKIDTVKLDNHLSDYLFNWLKWATVPKDQGFKYSLALKVNYLEFNKREDKGKTKYWLFYDLELFIKNPDSTYTPVYQGAEALEGVSSLSNKKNSDGILFTLLHWQFWSEFQNKINAIKFKSKLKENKALSVSEVYKKYSFAPILIADSLQAGSYETLDELINNKPSIASFDVSKKDMLVVDPSNPNNMRQFPISILFGYCDGKKVFINYNSSGDFIPVERLGTIFEVSGQAVKVYNEARNIRVRNATASTITNIVISGLKLVPTGISAAALIVGLIANANNPRFYFNTKTDGKLKEMDLVRIE